LIHKITRVKSIRTVKQVEIKMNEEGVKGSNKPIYEVLFNCLKQ
jgi:hypothetical protein